MLKGHLLREKSPGQQAAGGRPPHSEGADRPSNLPGFTLSSSILRDAPHRRPEQAPPVRDLMSIGFLGAYQSTKTNSLLANMLRITDVHASCSVAVARNWRTDCVTASWSAGVAQRQKMCSQSQLTRSGVVAAELRIRSAATEDCSAMNSEFIKYND